MRLEPPARHKLRRAGVDVLLFASRQHVRRHIHYCLAFTMNTRRLVLALVATFMAGCASVPAPSGLQFSTVEPTSSTHALVYILRTPHPLGKGVWPNVLIDDKVVANLTNGTFTVVRVSPGSYTFRTRMDPQFFLSAAWDSEAKIEVVAGRRYFLELTRKVENLHGLTFVGSSAYSTSSMKSSDHQLRVLPEEQATTNLAGLYYDKPLISYVP
ncbi:MAG: hypothetical protein CFE41_20460 [Burkholderiales bacterium PBB2]|nr:MAG: hypothetical protein CFE41_20460 [Burkholderiales bacterium PBB2]